jgi:hypothetical protein
MIDLTEETLLFPKGDGSAHSKIQTLLYFPFLFKFLRRKK